MQRRIIENIEESNESKKYRLEALEKLEKTEPPKWKRIKYEVSPREGYKEFKNIQVEGDVSFTVEGTDLPKSNKGGDSYLENFNKAYFNSGVVVDEGNRDIHIRYEMNNQNNFLQDLNYIRVPEDTKVNLIFEYSGEPEYGFRNTVIKVVVGRNAEVNIINLQRLGDRVESFSTIEIEAADRAKINQYHLELGGGMNGGSSRVYLRGENIQSENYSIYIADGDKKTDLEYSTYHCGRRGESLIEGRGIVKDRATKVFRGNLHFERGSGRSVGKEEETAVLMNKGVKADSIPTLFCKEDDVVGEHAASAGQLNENKLFYLMSRGLTESEAKKMVAISAFKPILEKLENKIIEERVLEDIERRI